MPGGFPQVLPVLEGQRGGGVMAHREAAHRQVCRHRPRPPQRHQHEAKTFCKFCAFIVISPVFLKIG